jgi:hypothetical protein
MERSAIRDGYQHALYPDFASLHPGYDYERRVTRNDRTR